MLMSPQLYFLMAMRATIVVAIVSAAMRKLVHIIYGVLKNDMPFDPNYQVKSP